MKANVTKAADVHTTLSQVDNSIHHSIIIQINVSLTAFILIHGICIGAFKIEWRLVTT